MMPFPSFFFEFEKKKKKKKNKIKKKKKKKKILYYQKQQKNCTNKRKHVGLVYVGFDRRLNTPIKEVY